MNKRQYKKIRKTKTEKKFLDYLKRVCNIHTLNKDKFYLFEMATDINASPVRDPLSHLFRYLKSTGIHLAFIPDGIFVNDFDTEKDYMEYLKNVKEKIEGTIKETETKIASCDHKRGAFTSRVNGHWICKCCGKDLGDHYTPEITINFKSFPMVGEHVNRAAKEILKNRAEE